MVRAVVKYRLEGGISAFELPWPDEELKVVRMIFMTTKKLLIHLTIVIFFAKSTQNYNIDQWFRAVKKYRLEGRISESTSSREL